jgi:hypothetical protein
MHDVEWLWKGGAGKCQIVVSLSNIQGCLDSLEVSQRKQKEG